MFRTTFLIAAMAAATAAQQPPISNANVVTAPAGGGLDSAIQAAINREAGPFWIGYSVPIIDGERHSCCWSEDGRGCGLEGNRKFTVQTPGGPVKLEGPITATILLRVAEKTVGKVRAFSGDCPLDAGGLTLIWLTDVRPADSVAMLVKRADDKAVHAIAMHAGPEAGRALEALARSGSGEKIRKSAVFWLANSRGRSGYDVVSSIARNDSSVRVREHAIFALTQSKEPEAIRTILSIAREDQNAHVRGQALFWLAQKASKQAAGAITEAIEGDPDTEVKKKAVFALTQMPAGEGVPMLIHVARNNSNPVVRKQAFFWLGQSKDPRALKFFEEILSK
jgi:hypothetical protein